MNTRSKLENALEAALLVSALAVACLPAVVGIHAGTWWGAASFPACGMLSVYAVAALSRGERPFRNF